MPPSNAFLPAIVAIAVAGLTPAAHAALGDTVNMDAIRAEAALVNVKRAANDAPGLRKVTPKSGFDQILSVDGSGAQVREAVAPSGKVFATTWEGEMLPDLKSLLGDHYDDYMRAAELLPPNARVLSTTINGVQMTFIKTLRYSRGSAVLVNELPAGVAADALK